MNDVEMLNQKYANCYKKTKRQDILERYVVSETLAPIGDYENAIKIISANNPEQASNRLLIIGAHLVAVWTQRKNEFLSMLFQRYHSLSSEEKAIAYFLKAQNLRFRNHEYRHNQEYRQSLEKSLSYDVRFVNNRMYYKDILSPTDAIHMYKEMITNVVRVYTQKELARMTPEQFADPDMFVKEQILGTHISHAVYQILMDAQ